MSSGSAYLAVYPKVGKIDTLKSHLLKGCKHIPAEVRAELDRSLKPPTPTVTPNASFSEAVPTQPADTETRRGPKRRKASGEQSVFEGDLVDWFVACGIPWNAANNPQTRDFATKWLPDDIVVPERRVLSGRVLTSQVAKVEDRIREKVNGKLATGQCDGWKNIAKTSVVTTVMSVENEVSLLNLFLPG